MRRAGFRLILLPLLLAASLLPVPPAAADAMDATPWVVVAVVDSGVNPYHREFSAATFPVAGADLARHPSTYLEGFPVTAQALHLTLGAPTYAAAKAADAAALAGVEKGKLYWIPGTKIVGAVDAGDNGFAGVGDATPLLDDYRHGTAVASLAAGNTLGQCTRCLLVVVEDTLGLKWAAAQPWIDVVVNSWGSAGNLGLPYPDERANAFTEHFWTRAGAECGQTLVFASGNGYETFTVPEQTYTSNTLGPQWVLRVGGYLDSGGSRIPMWGTGKPADVLGRGYDTTVARHDALTATASGFTGTSAAAPWTGGVFGETLRRARVALGDTTERVGCAGQVLAEGSVPAGAAPGSPLGDGRLVRAELWRAVLATARPAEFTGVHALPLGVDAPFLAPVNEGYGTVDERTPGDAVAALLAGTPARADVDAFFAQDRAVRELIWGPWDQNGDGTREVGLTALPHWSINLA